MCKPSIGVGHCRDDSAPQMTDQAGPGYHASLGDHIHSGANVQNQAHLIQILGLVLSNCVCLGKLLNLSEL